MSTDMKVWIGCLACYNNGRHVGAWYDAAGCDAITVADLHAGRPGLADLAPHEELWCFDFEGFNGLLTGECAPAEVAEVAALVAGLDAERREALGAYRAHWGGTLDADMVKRFGEAYQGRYESSQAFAQEHAEELADGLSTENLSWPFTYIDWEGAARELFMEDFWGTDSTDGGVHVFFRR